MERVVCGTILGIWQSFLELHTKPIKWRHVTEHGQGIILVIIIIILVIIAGAYSQVAMGDARWKMAAMGIGKWVNDSLNCDWIRLKAVRCGLVI